MDTLLKAAHANLTEIKVSGPDVFRMATAIQLIEQAIATAENAAEPTADKDEAGE